MLTLALVSFVGLASAVNMNPPDLDKVRNAVENLKQNPLFDQCLVFVKDHARVFIAAMYQDIAEESWGATFLFAVAAMLMGLMFCVTGKLIKLVLKTLMSWAVLVWAILAIPGARIAVGTYLLSNE